MGTKPTATETRSAETPEQTAKRTALWPVERTAQTFEQADAVESDLVRRGYETAVFGMGGQYLVIRARPLNGGAR